MPDAWTIRVGAFSRQIVLRPWIGVACVGFLTLVVFWSSLALGSVTLWPRDVLQALSQPDSNAGIIVLALRMPRVLLAALVGGALGLSGWLLQQVMRNPLAAPDILGVTSGASAAAVSYFSFFAASWGMAWLPLAAVVGALLAALSIYLLAWQRGTTPLGLVLMGIGMAALFGAVTIFVLVYSPLTTTLSAYVWLVGSVYGANWSNVWNLAAWCAALTLMLVPLLRLSLLTSLDDELAVGLGERVQRTRALILAVAAALAGVAIAWGGAFAFVGLVAPHLSRLINRRRGAAQVVMTALFGGLLVMLADLLGRTLFLPLDLPAGVFVGAIGAPFFLGLLVRLGR